MRNILIVGLLMCFAFTANAQEERVSKEERIKALKIGFITEELQLTSAESEDFWPIYNAHEQKEREIRATGRPAKMIDEMSDEEANAFIASRLKAEEDLMNLNKEYVSNLESVLSSKQMAKLMVLDKEFKRKMLENIRSKRKGERKEKMKK